MPSEQEETLYRMRTVRMAEKGFLPFDEAVGIYQPLTAGGGDPEEWQAPRTSAPEDGASWSVALYPSGMLDRDSPFAIALSQVDDEAETRYLQEQFATLCNRIVSADMIRVGGFDDLRGVVTKAGGYLSIGLQHSREEAAGQALLRQPLQILFRKGYQAVLALKWKARRFLEKAWFHSQGLPLRFWGEAGMGVLGGVLLKKPLYFDPDGGDRLYREFAAAKEVDKTAVALEDIVALDGLLADMAISVDESVRAVLDYRNLLLTLWAREHLSPGSGFAPLTLEQARVIMDRLFGEPVAEDAAAGSRRTISDSVKTDFLRWAARTAQRDTVDLSRRFSGILEALFKEVEMEYGGVETKDLDSRFLLHFVMSEPHVQPGDEDV